MHSSVTDEYVVLEAPRRQPGEPTPGNPPAPAYGEASQLVAVVALVHGARWVIGAALLTVLAAVILYTATVSPEYESSAILMVDTRRGSSGDLSEALLLGMGEVFGGGNRTLANEVEILRQSQVIAERTAEHLIRMRTIPGSGEMLTVLLSEDGRPENVQELAVLLQEEYLSITPISKDVDMIRVTATSTSPEEAALISNLYAQEYLNRSQEASRARVSASRAFLAEQEEKQREQLRLHEDKMQSYMSRHRAVALDEEAQHVVSQIAQLEASRDETSVEGEMTSATLAAMTEELARIEPNLARRVASGVELEIRKSQEKIAELELVVEQIYLRDPRLRADASASEEVRSLNRQIEELRRRVEALSAQYVDEVLAVGGVDPSVQARDVSGVGLAFVTQAAQLKRRIAEERIRLSSIHAREGVLTRRLQEYESKLGELPEQTMQLAQLQRAQQASEKLYLFLVEKLQEARVAEQSELGYVEVVRQALVPQEPVRPRLAVNLILGALFGLFLGLGIAIVRRQLDTRIRGPGEVRRLGVEPLGLIPDMSREIREAFAGAPTTTAEGREVRTVLLSALNPLGLVSEAYRRVRTNIQFSRPDKLVQVILVTSPGPGEGKSSTALNLAVVMAQAGRRTLYIDADLRRPTGHKIVGVAREPGLAELLFGLQDLESGAFATFVDGLFVIPAGTSVPNPAELLGSQKMRGLIDRLREEFDAIVIDTPPVLAVTDAVLLSPQSDAVVLVVYSGSTEASAFGLTTEALRNVGAPVVGAVVNRFDTQAARGYGYGYGHYNYDYASAKRSSAGPRRWRRWASWS